MNSKYKKCFFLSSRYPFGKTESFIENEIPFISKNFDDVYIFTMDDGKGFCRQTPKNIKVIALNIWNMRFKRITKFFCGLFSSYIKMPKHLSFRQLVEFIVERGSAYIICRKMIKYCNKNHISFNNSLFYSYWLNSLSAAVSLLKNKTSFNNSLFISRCHGADIYSERTPTNFLPLQLYSVSNLDFIFPVSNDGVNYLKNKYKQYSNKFLLSRLGTFDYGLNNSIIKNKIKFVTCSNLVPLKRLDLFAMAFSNVAEFMDVMWYCIGDGPEENKIKEIIESKKINNKVVFLGRMSNFDVMKFFKENDITFFVNVSEYEGLPVSLMEAMSFGIPCIATNVGGTRELFECKIGYLLEKNLSVESLTSYLSEICKISETEYCSLKNNARKTWEKQYNAELNYISFYKNLEKDNFEYENEGCYR